jgi:serine/threonine-protein kinase HipA
MGHRSHSKTLGLWSNGDYVGRWTVTASGESELHYDTAWRASPRSTPLSITLPFQPNGEPLKGAYVARYFEGLLPDSDTILQRLADRFQTRSVDAFELLEAVGRDCVGALQVLPDGLVPESQVQMAGVALDEAAIERHLLDVVGARKPGALPGPDDDFRIALAGAQEKDAFLWADGKWHKPRGATPTTHIFKLPMGLVGGRGADFSTSVDNEWLCLQLFKEFGLPTANAEIATFGSQRVLVVERFDRARTADGELLRVAQEDFCQATGTSPHLKYENDGGPGLKQLFALLQQSQHAAADMHTLMASQLLFWMLRAPDGHAKNFSLQLLAGGAGRFRLTPIYDVMSAYPVIGNGPNQWSDFDVKMAMALLGKNRHYLARNIQRRHFNSTARAVGYGDTAEPVIQDIIARTPAVIANVRTDLPAGFSEKVADRVLDGLLASAQALERMPAA